MSDPIRIIKHEAVPNCGSYEVRFPDGRASVFFYWDDVPGWQLQPDRLTGAGTGQGIGSGAAGQGCIMKFIADPRRRLITSHRRTGWPAALRSWSRRRGRSRSRD
jgi:hypothetical protein